MKMKGKIAVTVLLMLWMEEAVSSTEVVSCPNFENGDGMGTSEVKISSTLTGEKCIEACEKRKEIDGSINGVTVFKNSKGGCWCERKMKKVSKRNRKIRLYKTCLLRSGLRCNGVDNGCCTEATPCTEGDGDCDDDAHCEGSLVCGKDNCPKQSPFDNPRNTDDCCVKPPQTGLRCNGQDNGCCTEGTPCTEGDGDCDNDAHCEGSLVCGKDNCPKQSPFDNPRNTDDCCTKPAQTDLLPSTITIPEEEGTEEEMNDDLGDDNRSRVESTTYKGLGCFKDQKSPRAIAGKMVNFQPSSTAIQKCYERALSEGNSHFAIQYYTECYTHPNAGKTYARYGQTNGCVNGVGGSWKINVYQIIEKVDDKSGMELGKDQSEELLDNSKDKSANERRTSLDIAYARERKGSTDGSCGSLKAPCKHLKDVLKNCLEGGKVIVIGDHNVTSEIEVRKNVSIIGEGNTTIRGTTRSGFVFRVLKEVKVSFVQLNFQDCAVVTIQSKATVDVSNCSVVHNRRPKKNLASPDGRQTVVYGGQVYSIIKLQEKEGVVLNITNSAFLGVENLAVVYSDQWWALGEVTVSIISCIFNNNRGVDLKNRNVRMFLSNCSFNKSQVSIRIKSSSSLVVSRCAFNDVVGRAIAVQGGEWKVTNMEVIITESSFKNCTPWSTRNLPLTLLGGAIFVVGDESRMNSMVSIKRCLFYRNVDDKGDGGGDIRVLEVNTATIDNCCFRNSRASVSSGDGNYLHDGGSIFIQQTNISITDSLFTNCSAKRKGGAVIICQSVECDGKSGDKERSVAVLRNCTFKENQAGIDGGALWAELGGVLKLESCTFDGNRGVLGGGVMLRMFENNERAIQSIVFVERTIFKENSGEIGGALYVNKNMKNWRPIEYRGLIAGDDAPYSIQISGSVFIDNFARSSGQSIFNDDNLQMINITILSNEPSLVPHLYSERGNIDLNNLSLKLRRTQRSDSPRTSGIIIKSDEIRVSNGLKLSCPKNFKIDEVKNTTGKKEIFHLDVPGRGSEHLTVYTFLQVDCVSCPVDSYNLKHGSYYIEKLLSTTNTRAYNASIQNPRCMMCPTGATCNVNVKAMDNFWGYEEESELKFQLCPRGFCCAFLTNPCSSYDTCAVGRKGTLCGTCSEGYKQNFVGGDCIPKGHQCDVTVFITYFIVYTIVYTAVFILITNMKDIIVFVKSLLTKPTSESGSEETEDDGATDDTFSMAGFVQIVILFFQVAGLLQVKFQGEAIRSNVSSNGKSFLEDITNFFNFRFVVYQEVCPSDQLTLPQKEMFLFSMKLATFMFLFLLVIIYKVVKKLLCCSKSESVHTTSPPSDEPSIELMSGATMEKLQSEAEAVEAKSTVAFMSMLKCTFIKLLKLYYTPIVVSALMMIHCVNIRNESRLYVYGDHVCLSGWQIGIIIFLLPCLLLFPVCFELAVRMLKERMISSWQFVLAAMCSFYSIFLYVLRRTDTQREKEESPTHISVKDEAFRATILEGEELLFKEVQGHTMGWTVVQFYRTFAMSALNTFLTNPFYRLMAYNVLVMVFIIHDNNRQPYKNEYLNTLQSLTSRCLMLVIVCNIIPAISYLVNVQSVPSIYDIVKVLGAIELIVYAVVPLSLPMWKLKTYIDKKRKERAMEKSIIEDS